jgi:hypothetical protein
LQGKSIKTSYFQPIIDALEIRPYSLDAPLNKSLIVEGIYDYCGFKLMFEFVLNKKLDFAIFPGTGASGHETLISLNIGWGSSIFVLLDNDDEGRQSRDKYHAKFPILDKKICVLDFLSKNKNYEFEDLFEVEERQKLASLAGFNGKVTKKVFQQTVAAVLYSGKLQKQAKTIIGPDTLNKFKQIFERIEKELK